MKVNTNWCPSAESCSVTQLKWNPGSDLDLFCVLKAVLQRLVMIYVCVCVVCAGRGHLSRDPHHSSCEGGLWEGRFQPVWAAQGFGTRLVWEGLWFFHFTRVYSQAEHDIHGSVGFLYNRENKASVFFLQVTVAAAVLIVKMKLTEKLLHIAA